jgi:WD40 repeat protein
LESGAVAPSKAADPGQPRNFDLPREEMVMSVALSPDGRKVVAGTMGGSVWIWSTDKPHVPTKFKATEGDLLFGSVLSLAFSSDGKLLLLGCADHSVRLWDMARGKEIHRLKGHGGPVWSVVFFKDGKRALSGSTSDYAIREWDLEKGKELRRFKGEDRPDSLSLSPDEKSLVTTEFKTVQLWDLETGKRGQSFEGHRFRVNGAFFTPDGKHIISGSLGEVRVWDVKAGKSLSKFGDADLNVESVALSRDGRRVLLGGTNELQLWDVQTGKKLKRIEDLSGTVKVAFSPDGRYALSGDMGGRVRLWELPPGKRKD